jgi:hypothetical protein
LGHLPGERRTGVAASRVSRVTPLAEHFESFVVTPVQTLLVLGEFLCVGDSRAGLADRHAADQRQANDPKVSMDHGILESSSWFGAVRFLQPVRMKRSQPTANRGPSTADWPILR